MKTNNKSGIQIFTRTVLNDDGTEFLKTSGKGENPWFVVEYDDTPGFYKDSRNGTFRYNPYKVTRSEVVSDSTRQHAEGKTVFPVVSHQWLAGYIADLHREAGGPYVSDMRDNAINAARAGAQRNIASAIVTLGEFPETLRYILGKLQAIYSIMKKRPKGTRKNTRNEDRAAQWWLEYRYAVIPMIVDIQQWIEYFQTDRAKLLRDYEKAVPWPLSSSRKTQSYSRKHTAGRPRYGQHTFIRHQIDGELSVDVGIRYKAPRPTGFYLAGVAPEFILPAAWDLVPFSWLIDWFVNLSSFFGSLSFSLGNYEYLGGWVTTKYTGTCKSTVEVDYVDKYNPEEASGAAYTTTYIKERKPLYWAPTIRRQHPEVRLNASKIVDMIALLISFSSSNKVNRRIYHG